MNNVYKEFFEVLKSYLVELGIEEKHKGIEGCSKAEIQALEKRVGQLPLAYKEFLSSIGKQFLFEFMDAEDMAFDDLDYIEEFGKEVFEENKLVIERPYMVISERRNEYISLIYLDSDDNPKVWIMTEYWDDNDDGENLVVRTESFTDLILAFFSQMLGYYTAGFHFVTAEDQKDEDVIKKRYMKWYKSLVKIEKQIEENQTDNPFIKELNERLLGYYLPSKPFILDELADFEYKYFSWFIKSKRKLKAFKIQDEIKIVLDNYKAEYQKMANRGSFSERNKEGLFALLVILVLILIAIGINFILLLLT
ncbi:MAG: SMI1/KNR4 family protein [Saprospiraceae bacterium]